VVQLAIVRPLRRRVRGLPVAGTGAQQHDPRHLSVAAELCHSLARRTRGGRRGTFAIAAIALAMGFSVWIAGATGAEAVQRGALLILIGISVYVRAAHGAAP
jgi:hypothetical protein